LEPKTPSYAELRERVMALTARVRELETGGADDQDAAARDALRTSERRFRDLVEGSLQGIVVHRDLVPLFANQSMARMLGYDTVADLLALPDLWPIMPEHERSRIREYNRMRHSGGSAPDFYDMQLARRDGELISVRVFMRVVDWMGAPATQVTLIDVTEQVRAEAALRENERFTRETLNSLPVAVSVKDPAGRITLVNKEYERIYGLREEDVLGRRPDDLLDEPPDESVRRNEHEQRVIARREYVSREAVIEVCDQPHRQVQVVKTPLLDDDGEVLGVCSAVTDVTALKKVQAELTLHRDRLEELVRERTAELARANEELLRTGRLAAIGELTATVGHELRNPLGTVKNSVYGLRAALETGDQERVDRAIERTERNVDRCVAIVEQLLDYTRVADLSREPTDIDEWLREGVAELEEHLDARTELLLRSGAVVSIDRDSIHRVVLNALQNAWQAVRGQSQGQVWLETQSSEELLEIRIRDNGPGIDVELIDSVFDPLVSTKSFGVGLGLAVIRNVMTQHGGGASFVSAAPGDTTLLLWMPLAGNGGAS
jgi:PAS domain S-box-containing protein